MNRLFKSAVLATAVAATALAPLGQANAGPARGATHQPQVERQNNNGDVLIAGLLGAAVGAVVVGALARDDHPEGDNPYRHPRPSIDRELLFGNLFDDPAPDPAVVDHDGDGSGDDEYYAYADGGDDEFAYDDGNEVYADGGYDQTTYLYEPWTRDWYRYCARTYDTFDPNTGTYFDRWGTEQFCVADY